MVSSISGSDIASRQQDGRAPIQGAARGPARASDAESTTQNRAPVRSPADAINVLRARLDQQLQQGLGSPAHRTNRVVTPDFETPSAADVAGRVLGFVQSRLQQEAEAGADQARLAGLLDQARAGITRGFSEAREQIEALGMMTDDLSAQIDDSFLRIQGGLDELRQGWVTSDGPGRAVNSASVNRLEASARDQLAFQVQTRDGDVVTVRMDESRYSSASRAEVNSAQGSASRETAVSLFAGSYRFSVEGNLDSGERDALTALFSDIEDVAGKFFDGDVQSAFSAARSLRMDGSELASFSLNLSSVRSVRASSYESVASQPSVASQLRPLAGLARDVQSLGSQSDHAGLSRQSLGELMEHMLADRDARQSESLESDHVDLMNKFWKAIIDGLAPDAARQGKTGD